MSCQQAARFLPVITSNASVTSKTCEDPYVFTETVPTPPLSVNVQKPKAKKDSLNVLSSAKSTNQKLPLTQLNGFAAKAPTHLVNYVTFATPAFKNEQNRKPATSNACSPCVKQPQQQQQLHLQQTSLPTPSLWQTPLLLEAIVSPPTSPASLPSPPAHLPNTSAPSTLPPSNFHHTTFDQHLQKVGSIRKSPPAQTLKARNSNSNDVTRKTTTRKAVATMTATTAVSKPHKPTPSVEATLPQHSDQDLNEIPVNVIYRRPQSTGAIACAVLPTKLEKTVATQDTLATTVATFTTITTTTHVVTNLHQKTTDYVNSLAPSITKSSIVDEVAAASSSWSSSSSSPSLSSSSSSSSESKITRKTPTTAKAEKCLQTDVFPTRTTTKPFQRRKALPSLPPTPKKPSATPTNQKAFAVVTYSAASGDRDDFVTTDGTDQTAAAICRQHHWLEVYEIQMTAVGGGNKPSSVLAPNMTREERIEQHKSLLRRQAMQLLAMRPLLQTPLMAARRRLLCVDRLLRKYEDHREVDYTATCTLPHCKNRAMPMAAYCYTHIGYCEDQQLFPTCTAKFSDNSKCRVPVFDIEHELPLCQEHARKRDTYDRISREQHLQKVATVATASGFFTSRVTAPTSSNYNNNSTTIPKQPPKQRNKKRKTCSANSNVIKPAVRAQKRPKKSAKQAKPANTPTPAPPPLLPTAKQRKSSNTSLESIASNSQSSYSQSPFILSTATDVGLAPPALAPLSRCGGGSVRYNPPNVQQQHYNYSGNAAATYAAGFPDEFNRILDFSSSDNNPMGVQSATANDNNNSNSHTDFSSGLSLPSADEFLTQDMLSVCDNSSAYASSEDTGVGGLSETELMGAANNGSDDIPLGDTRLLEEHDLANVLSNLPVDAFNELFTAVRQDERDEVERALEIADKHLKSLQQTIGTGSDFLGDFLDVDDHMLGDNDICSKMEIVSSVLHSPETSGLDTAALFGLDGGGGSNTGSGSGSCSSAMTDIRGLLQT